MEIFKTKAELQFFMGKHREEGGQVALVPTMGALHQGHIALIEEARQAAPLVVCSIFVNPTQFNDPKDLAKYPRPIENDISLLQQAGCDVLFMPSEAEMYPADEAYWHIDLGDLDRTWEGEKRPGHFQGVTQIVYKLFRLVEPDIACFGQKDFQQVMVIQRLVHIKRLPIHIMICPTVRNSKGLALSSRNSRLSAKGKEKALALYRALLFIKEHKHDLPMDTLRRGAFDILVQEGELTVEYLAICESSSLLEVSHLESGKDYVALVAAWVEGVRLIDNMILN
ncbi:pantoate--beta-alanine ligase [Sphingobacterium griseoflavum]|uniref:Pantothenate synthetase n=1 Tax=Sphingobacterium griseoflavum TaxID=1474952 RepID=A0ABQ3HVI9_9SPHI|nr:pantoate--beta-alanine ligase [Sphingobacterium griseoflavum]GHE23837.1 pantothenate synthetase [Sphingobacterium griseoflavum]